MRGGVYPRLTSEIMRGHARPFRGAQVPSFFVFKLADKNGLDGGSNLSRATLEP